jgi:hypoxanthine phosphoribosyltransferase
MKNKFPILISEEQIKKRVSELGQKISSDYVNKLDKPLVVIGVLKGSFVFLADLVRSLEVPCEIEFIEVSSYGAGTSSSGRVKLKREPSLHLADRHVLIVEDIIDTGHTFEFLEDYFVGKHLASYRTCAFLDKPSRRQVEMKVDYSGFEIDDHFVVGYGLDLDGRYREISSVVIYQQS